MKALLPVYCRIVGYIILLLAIFIPFGLVIYGVVTDSNLLFYKEVIKFFMMMGLLMILLAHTSDENEETTCIRIRAMRNAFFLTILFVFGTMVYRLYTGSFEMVDTSSFIIFMAMNVICLEYGIKKAKVDKMFKGK